MGKCFTVRRSRVQRPIMTNVTWSRFDQSAQQLVVGHTTNKDVSVDWFCCSVNHHQHCRIRTDIYNVAYRYLTLTCSCFMMWAMQHGCKMPRQIRPWGNVGELYRALSAFNDQQCLAVFKQHTKTDLLWPTNQGSPLLSGSQSLVLLRSLVGRVLAFRTPPVCAHSTHHTCHYYHVISGLDIDHLPISSNG